MDLTIILMNGMYAYKHNNCPINIELIVPVYYSKISKKIVYITVHAK